jgi:hypothetical protein
MATATFIPKTSVLTVNSVDLSDQVVSATMRFEYDALPIDTIASSAHNFTAGLENNSCSITFLASYASSEPWATLSSLVGTTTTITIKPATGASSATNPTHTLTGTFVPGFDVYSGSAGELMQIVLETQGGSYTSVTS